MSTIRKRDNKYQVVIRRKGFAAVYRSFHSRADALEWSRHMESLADRGDLPSPTKMLDSVKLCDVIIRYKNEITVKKLSASTEGYLLDAFLRQPLANLTLAQLTSAHFASYRDKRLKNVKPGTVNRELGIIKHALDIAAREWNIPIKDNPLSKVKKLRVRNARTRRISDDEYKALMDTIESSRNGLIKPLMNFAIETGMRRGEILRLKWIDIDYISRTLHIPITKNGHSRTIPISSRAIKILQEIQKQEDADKNGPFQLSDNAAKLVWQRLLKRSGIQDLHFHDFRHEAISRFFEKGLSVPEVALISGHKDYKMLFRYTHLKPEELARKLLDS